jgi:hypothetical protein
VLLCWCCDFFVLLCGGGLVWVVEETSMPAPRHFLKQYIHTHTHTCAQDMRKALPRDREKKSVIPMTRPISPSELEW